nr:hypothetical protein [uncultured Chryseobacterium sp.]
MKVLFFFFMLLSTLCFSQQTEEFKRVKEYYNQHRSMLSQEFRKKFDAENNSIAKTAVRQDFLFFMKKMDSIENVALTGALVKVKNLEDLKKISISFTTESAVISHTTDQSAVYPGGIDTLRKHVAHLFYGEGVHAENGNSKAVVAFIVEKDGSISNVKAEGDNFTFNRQAEIALYSIPDKFSPASVNGNPVRYSFRLPLAMNPE